MVGTKHVSKSDEFLEKFRKGGALSLNGSLFRDPGSLYVGTFFGILGPYWVSIYFSGSLFSVFWLHSREECQFSLHVYNNELS